MSPDDLITIRPCIATSWEYLPDGKTVRFKLRDDVKFVSGNPLTAEDVRFSFTRLLNMKYQASQYLAHVDHVAVVDAHTVDFVLKDPSQPLLTIIAAPEFGISEKAAVIAHGGMDGPDTADKDTATPWLDQNSVGSGAFRLTGWQRNQQISLVANPGLLGRQARLRPVADPPYERECGAASGAEAWRCRCRVQPDPRAGGDAEGRPRYFHRPLHQP